MEPRRNLQIFHYGSNKLPRHFHYPLKLKSGCGGGGDGGAGEVIRERAGWEGVRALATPSSAVLFSKLKSNYAYKALSRTYIYTCTLSSLSRTHIQLLEAQANMNSVLQFIKGGAGAAQAGKFISLI